MGFIKEEGHFRNYISKAIQLNSDCIDHSDLLSLDEYCKLIYDQRFMNDYTFKLRENPFLLERYSLTKYLKENDANPHNMLDAVAKNLQRLFVKEFQDFISNLFCKSGVYLFETHKGKSLYIGVSINLHERILSSYWTRFKEYKSPVYLRVCQTSNKADAHILEMYFINVYQPIMNTTGNHKELPTLQITNIPPLSERICCERINQEGVVLDGKK